MSQSSGSSKDSGSSSSRSPSPVPFSVVDLTSYWPIHRLSVKIPPRELWSTEISPQSDGNGGFSVTERAKNKIVVHSIPSQYLNSFSLLTAKIVWLQMNSQYLTQHLAKKKEDEALANFLDGLRRNLTFSIAIRDLFYDDIQEAYPIANATRFSPSFRSRHLDSWLYVEFHATVHHPPNYKEFIELKYADKEPINIGVQEWLDWAADKGAEWTLLEQGSHLRFAHRRDHIPNACFMVDLNGGSKRKRKAGGISKELVDKLWEEQVKINAHDDDESSGEDQQEGPPPKKKQKVSSSTSEEQKSALAMGKMPVVKGKMPAAKKGKMKSVKGKGKGEGGQAVKARKVKVCVVGLLETPSMVFSEEVDSGVRGDEETTTPANPPSPRHSLTVSTPEKGQGQGSVAAAENENASDLDVMKVEVGLLTVSSDASEGVYSRTQDDEITSVHSAHSANPPSGPLMTPAAEERASTADPPHNSDEPFICSSETWRDLPASTWVNATDASSAYTWENHTSLVSSAWGKPSESSHDYTSFFFRPGTGKEEVSKEKVSKSSGQRENETWQEFFARRDEENKAKESMETPKDRQARLSRERDRGFGKAKCWEWLYDDNGILNRTSVERAYGRSLYDSLSVKYMRYDAFRQEWDFCEEEGFGSFGRVSKNCHEEDEDEGGDDDDDSDGGGYPAPTNNFTPPRSSFAAADNRPMIKMSLKEWANRRKGKEEQQRKA